MEINNKVIKKIDDINKVFYQEKGYYLCRCYQCIIPVVFGLFDEKGIDDNESLKSLISNINYIYKICEDDKSEKGNEHFKCSCECNFYENMIEAYPFVFWEIDKSYYDYFKNILVELYYIQNNKEN